MLYTWYNCTWTKTPYLGEDGSDDRFCVKSGTLGLPYAGS